MNLNQEKKLSRIEAFYLVYKKYLPMYVYMYVCVNNDHRKTLQIFFIIFQNISASLDSYSCVIVFFVIFFLQNLFGAKMAIDQHHHHKLFQINFKKSATSQPIRPDNRPLDRRQHNQLFIPL